MPVFISKDSQSTSSTGDAVMPFILRDSNFHLVWFGRVAATDSMFAYL